MVFDKLQYNCKVTMQTIFAYYVTFQTFLKNKIKRGEFSTLNFDECEERYFAVEQTTDEIAGANSKQDRTFSNNF